MERVKVYFYTRAHNAAPFIKQAVESVLNQTVTDILYMVHDNGSDDDTGKICKELSGGDDRIYFIHTDENEGHQKAYRRFIEVLEKTEAEYFAFLDADDYYMPDFAEKLCEIADKNKADVVSGTLKRVNIDGAELHYDTAPSITVRNHRMKGSEFVELYGVMHSLCGKIYSTRILSQFKRANETVPDFMRLGEDFYHNLGTFMKVDTFISTLNSIYSYRIYQTQERQNYYSQFIPESISVPGLLYKQCVRTAKSFGVYNKMTRYRIDMDFVTQTNHIIGTIINASNLKEKEKLLYLKDIMKGVEFNEVYRRRYALGKVMQEAFLCLKKNFKEQDETWEIYNSIYNEACRERRYCFKRSFIQEALKKVKGGIIYFLTQLYRAK